LNAAILNGASAAGAASITVSDISDLGANVTTSGIQTYTGAVTLSAATVITTTNSNVTLGSTINGANALTVSQGTGTLTFSGIVGGSTSLASISVNGSGTLNINGGEITTTGNQSYSGPVLIGANTTLTTSGGNVLFSSSIKSVTSERNITINAGSGNVTISGDLGNSTSETLNQASITQLTGGDPGEGGDFVGTFTHAINFGGSSYVLGDVTFATMTASVDVNGVVVSSSQSQIVNNVTLWSVNQINNWTVTNAVSNSSANDQALRDILSSIRWTGIGSLNSQNAAYDGKVGMQVSNLTVGNTYKLQLLVNHTVKLLV
jgi:hypothetical protein